MNELTTERIGEVVIEALERTAFVLADAVDKDEAETCGNLSNHSRVNFTGDVNGEVHLAATDGFLRELAASLLGIDASEIDLGTHGRDALCELTNIVGGSIILELGGDERPYEYGLPEVLENVPFTSASGEQDVAYFIADEDALAVYWKPVQQESQAAA